MTPTPSDQPSADDAPRATEQWSHVLAQSPSSFNRDGIDVVRGRFVEPNDIDPGQTAKRRFEALGWGKHAEWLAPLVFEGCAPPPDRLSADGTSYRVAWIAEASLVALDETSRMLELLARVAGIGQPYFAEQAVQEIANAAGIHVPQAAPMASYSVLSALMSALHERGLQPEKILVREWPASVIAGGSVEAQLSAFAVRGGSIATTESAAPPAVTWMQACNQADPLRIREMEFVNGATLGDPSSLATWLTALGASALEGEAERVKACGDLDAWSARVLHVRPAIDAWLLVRLEHFESFDRIGPEGHAPLHKMLARGIALMTGTANRLNSAHRSALLWLARATLGCVAGSRFDVWQRLEDSARRTLASVATERLALERSTFRTAGGDCEQATQAAASFDSHRRALSDAVCLLAEYQGIWSGMKPMLLAWRALGAPAVARDLRYWNESGLEPVPQPWSQLVMWPIALLHSHARAEEVRDPHLHCLRCELADYCLDRLLDKLDKSKRAAARAPRSSDEMKEPSAEWRYAYIRAFSVLGVNPKGSARSRLEISCEIDPDESVRDAAATVLNTAIRNESLPEDVSPRRAVLSALWWLRQGHLLALGLEPDPDGAQRTRVKELARTRERRIGAADGAN